MYQPIPFRSGNTVVRKYVERQEDKAYNISYVTLVDWKDSKGKLHERHTLFVKWATPIVPAWSKEFRDNCLEIYKDVCADNKANAKELNDRMAKRLYEEFGFRLPDQNFYVSVGVYPNLYTRRSGYTPQGMWKSNYVHRDHIYSHLLYNIVMRPGRTFFIDNVCYNNGMHYTKGFLAARRHCEKVTERIRKMPPHKETTPYE
jgi:hypothetical protein